MPEPEDVTVWRAGNTLRVVSYAGIALLLLLALKVGLTYGPLATLGILLILAAAFQVWWTTLRPRLIAGPDGVAMVAGREPVQLAWRDIHRCEAHGRGVRILCADGREFSPRFPALPRGAEPTPDSEVVRAAAFLTARAAWSRKSTGARPAY